MGLTKISDDAAKVSGYRKGLEVEIERKTSSMKAENEKLAVVESQIVAARLIVDQLDKEKKERLDGLKTEEIAIQRGIATAGSKEIDLKLELSTLREARATFSGKIAAIDAIGEKISNGVEEAVKRIARFTEAKNSLNSSASQVLSQADRVKSRAGEECETCGVLMDSTAVSVSLTRYNSKFQEINRAFKDAEDSLSGAKSVKEKLSESNEAFKKNRAELKESERTLDNSIKEVERKIAGIGIQVAEWSSRLLAIKKERESVSSSTGDEARANLERLNGQRKEISELITTTAAYVVDIEERLKTASILEGALGNAGLKSLIFDQVTPDLNRYTNEYLSILDNGMYVEISTISKLKTGEIRDKFSVNVDTSNGAANFSGNSGGERQKVNLAIALAFNRLMREISGAVPDVLVLDEPFEALDAASSEQAVGLLKELSASNIFLITHNKEIRDLVADRIYIRKKDGISIFIDSVKE